MLLQDLKKHNYYYWFAFPTISEPMPFGDRCEPISTYFSASEYQTMIRQYFSSDTTQHSFFIMHKNTHGDIVFKTLASEINSANKAENFRDSNLAEVFFCFSDPSSCENAGWPLRLYLLALIYHW